MPQLSVSRLEGAILGATVEGLDPSKPLTESHGEALRRALSEHKVLFIRGQQLNDDELETFASIFGELTPPGPNVIGRPFLSEHPLLNVISNKRDPKTGEPMGSLGDGEAHWHQDMTYVRVPPKATVLHAVQLAGVSGGDTCWNDMTAVYESLPPELRAVIDNCGLRHDEAYNSGGQLRKGYRGFHDIRLAPGPVHPVVWADPVTGRRSLILGRRRHALLVGMSLNESEDILDQLWAHATKPEFGHTHSWHVHDTAVWHNLLTLHRRDAFTGEREMHRAQIGGDGPLLSWQEAA